MQQLFKLTDTILEAQDSLFWHLANEKEFEEILKGLITRFDCVHVDLTKCQYINSSYISILVFYHFLALMNHVRLNIKISPRHQKHFSLANGISALNLEIVPTSGLDVPVVPA